MGHTSFQLDRRAFLKAGVAGAAALAVGPAFLRRAFAAGPVTVTPAGPYGALQPFDANGIALPPGFTSREIARGGQNVAGSSVPYPWHFATDGQATFPTLGTDDAPDGGWILVANSEMPIPGAGGVSAVEFAADGTVERAYRILVGTTANCAGGPTPWGTWLSCEEHDEGQVHECDPTGTPADAAARPALGLFAHEAVCVDPVGERLYLTEDEGEGCWYRFTPDEYPDLSAGLLEAAIVAADGTVTWAEVPEPGGGATNPTRDQVAGATRFDGGEGTWYDEGRVYFTTKGDNRVWLFDIATSKLEVLYDASVVGPDAPLSGVDNITVSQSGDIYVCEDGRDHDICLITPDFTISRFLKLDPTVHAGPDEGSPVEGNETVGVVFNPAGTKMYFGAQRSFAEGGQGPRGVVYEVSGPFRAPPSTTEKPDGAKPDETTRQQQQQQPGDAPPPDGPRPPATNPEPPPPPTDRVAPGFRVGVRRRGRVRSFLRSGIPVTIELDEPAGVTVTLEVVPNRGRWTTIARSRPTVAVRGRVVLRLRAQRTTARRLRGRSRVTARVVVTATDAAGNRRVARRTVTLR
ncbi:MAG TPA: alkaline phosphatase PhoX [Solirubrobacteraceae bacterium]|nr:alkaline phosphatase PhoX [Solirubrobacteraceae bacterium]